MKRILSLEDLRFFAAIAESPSLAAAARVLNVTPPAVSQRMHQLEARLALQLTDRSTRRLALTAEGEFLAAHARSVLSEIAEIEDSLAARRDTVAGKLRIVAPFGFGRRFIAGVVGRFRQAHPETRVALILSDNPLRYNEETSDLLIHVGELRDTNLVAHRIAPNERLACAAPSYLRRRGYPSCPLDLREHECVVIRENDEDVTLWHFSGSDGKISAVRTDPMMISNDGDVVHQWALAGFGIIVRSEWNVADDLRAGRLVRILPEWSLPPADVVALVSQRNRRTARSAKFLALLREEFAAPPWRR